MIVISHDRFIQYYAGQQKDYYKKNNKENKSY